MEARVPPNAKEIETTVLGAMLMDNGILPLVFSRMFPDVLYHPINRTIFSAMQKLYDNCKPVDIETVAYQLKTSNDLDRIGGVYEIVKLTHSVVSTAALETHISILLECYMKREAINISVNLMNEGYENGSDPFDIVSKANDEFLKITEKVLKGTEKNMTHYVVKVAEQRAKVLQTGTIGLPTGFPEVDEVIGGWVAPDLIIVAARPGMGKTALMLSTLHSLSVKQNKPGAVFSLEMSGEQLTERLEAIDSNIFHKKLRYNHLNDYDRRLLSESENRLSKAPIYIEDRGGITMRDLRTRAHLLKRKYGIQYIMVDYLQLMRGQDERGKSRENIISDISRGCKELAKELEVPLIALSQLSRAVETRPDKMPQLSDLRESGSIEQDADEVIFLMRPEYYNFLEPVEIGSRNYETKGLVICKIDKNRHGETKNIALKFEPEIMKYSNYEKEAPFQLNGYKAMAGFEEF